VVYLIFKKKKLLHVAVLSFFIVIIIKLSHNQLD